MMRQVRAEMAEDGDGLPALLTLLLRHVVQPLVPPVLRTARGRIVIAGKNL